MESQRTWVQKKKLNLRQRGPQNLRWVWRSRSVAWLHHLSCQCSQAISEEILKLFWMWQSWSPCEGFPEESREDYPKSKFKCKRGDNEEGRLDSSETSGSSTNVSRWGSQSLRMSQNFFSWIPIHLLGGADLRTELESRLMMRALGHF